MLNKPCNVKFATYIQLTRFNGVSLPLQTAAWEGWAVTSTTPTNGKASPSVQGKAFTTEWKHSRRKEKNGSLNSSWILGQAWSLIKWYVNFLLHQHYSQENWNILTKKKKKLAILLSKWCFVWHNDGSVLLTLQAFNDTLRWSQVD